jgi:hypothetical protein
MGANEPTVQKKSSIIGPIIVGVTVAILAGGTAPWWWSKVFPPQQPPVVVESALRSLHGFGTADAAVQVYPEKFRRRAYISASAVARTANDGGCMRIEISGVGEMCKSKTVYRNPGGSEDLKASLDSVRTIEADTSPEITAGAPNGEALKCPGADAVSVTLSVDFARD